MQGEKEGIEIKTIAGVVTKIVLILCVTGLFVFWGYSCGLGTDTIQECKTACNSSGSQMRSVTPRECVCEKSPAEAWVIPRK